MEDNMQDDRKTILVVDDEKDILGPLLQIVESIGYWAIGASSGPEAIEEYKANREKIDLVMLDIIMPGMDGCAVYDELRKLNPQIIVLFSSGHPSSEEKIRGILSRGQTELINKPYGHMELGLKLAGLI